MSTCSENHKCWTCLNKLNKGDLGRVFVALPYDTAVVDFIILLTYIGGGLLLLGVSGRLLFHKKKLGQC